MGCTYGLDTAALYRRFPDTAGKLGIDPVLQGIDYRRLGDAEYPHQLLYFSGSGQYFSHILKIF